MEILELYCYVFSAFLFIEAGLFCITKLTVIQQTLRS